VSTHSHPRRLVIDTGRFALVVCPTYEDLTDAGSSPLWFQNAQSFSWPWLSTINRVNSQVMKVRHLLHAWILGVCSAYGADVGPLLRYHPLVGAHVPRGAQISQMLSILLSARGHGSEVHSGPNEGLSQIGSPCIMVCIDMIIKRSQIGWVAPTFLPRRNYESDWSLTNLDVNRGCIP